MVTAVGSGLRSALVGAKLTLVLACSRSELYSSAELDAGSGGYSGTTGGAGTASVPRGGSAGFATGAGGGSAGFVTGADVESQELTVGFASSCARNSLGQVRCWGSNTFGELGISSTEAYGDDTSEVGPFPPAELSRAIQRLVAGPQVTCAEYVGTGWHCWGRNDQGQLGLGDTQHRGDQPGELWDALPALDLGSFGARQIALGYSFSCALAVTGRVRCWGTNEVGQLGFGDTKNRGDEPGDMGNALPEVDLGLSEEVEEVAAGSSHTCIRTESGRVKCWGLNDAAQLGLGDERNRGGEPTDMGISLPFVDLGPNETATRLALGSDFSCALLKGGRVKCWGQSGAGQLGQGEVSFPAKVPSELHPIDLGTGLEATAISAGGYHACALFADGRVKCWGFNGYGQLGLGDQEPRGNLRDQMGDRLPFVELGRPALQIGCGYQHTCALLDDHRVKCWGRGDPDGQLGLGDERTRGDERNEMGDALPTVPLSY